MRIVKSFWWDWYQQILNAWQNPDHLFVGIAAKYTYIYLREQMIAPDIVGDISIPEYLKIVIFQNKTDI